MIVTCLCALGPVSSRPSSGFSGWSEHLSLPLFWHVDTDQDAGTEIPSRLLYRLDGWYLVWELPIEGDAVEEHVVPKILPWSTGNSPPVPQGSWPAVAAECFVTFVVDCEASEQWKTVSDWTAEPSMGVDNDHWNHW